MESIYTLTTYDSNTRKSRTWSWYPSLEETEAAVRDAASNDYFFESGTYDFVCVEEVKAGVRDHDDPESRRIWWFALLYDHVFEAYTVIPIADTPDFAKGTHFFSMGLGLGQTLPDIGPTRFTNRLSFDLIQGHDQPSELPKVGTTRGILIGREVLLAEHTSIALPVRKLTAMTVIARLH